MSEHVLPVDMNEKLVPSPKKKKAKKGREEKKKLTIFNAPNLIEDARPLTLLDDTFSEPQMLPIAAAVSVPSSGSGARCCTCSAEFADFVEQRQHFRLDWHRFNVQNALRRRPALTEEQFEALVINEEIASVSGSESSEDEDEENSWKSNRSPMAYFCTEDKCVFSLLKHLLPADSLESVDFRLSAGQLPSNIAVLMMGGGHFAGAVFDPTGHAVVHKTFHSYTVRAKQGGSQASADNKNGTAKSSAGASLRRYNEASFEKHVNDIMNKWENLLDKCDIIFYRTGNESQRRMLFPGYNNDKDKSSIWTKVQHKCRKIPFPTRRATFKEVQRIFELVTSVEVHGQLHEFEDRRREERKREIKVETERRRRIHRSKSREPKMRPSPIEDANLRSDRNDTSIEDDGSNDDDIDLTWVTESVSTLHLREFEVDKGNKGKEKSKEKVLPSLKNDLITSCKANDTRLLRSVLDDLEKTELSSLRIGTKPEMSPLHLAAMSGSVGVLKILLSAGADPCVKDGLKRLPYHVSANREVRQAFMGFRAENEDAFDFDLAQIPLGLNEEQERLRKERQKEKKREKRKQKQEEKKREEEMQKIEKQKEDEKKRFQALSDREKRALAAEKRLKAQNQHGGVSSENCCMQCKADMMGKVPFTYDQFRFCALKCLQIHRKANSK